MEEVVKMISRAAGSRESEVESEETDLCAAFRSGEAEGRVASRGARCVVIPRGWERKVEEEVITEPSGGVVDVDGRVWWALVQEKGQ